MVCALLLFVPFLGHVNLFDWDEINFAECAREMIVTGNYSSVKINFLPFWEKPPLFIWMQAVLMNVFGISEFSARLPNAICGIVTLLLLFNIGKKIKDERLGLLWVLFYCGSLLPHLYFRSGIIDPWFNLFIFCGLYGWYRYAESIDDKEKSKQLIFSGILTGLAILTKGPVAVLITFMCVLIFGGIKYKFSKSFISIKHIGIYVAALLVTGGSWFIIELLSGNKDIILEFIEYQVRLFNTEDSGHGGPFYYHIVVLLIGCFPASVFAIGELVSKKKGELGQHNFSLLLLILLCVVLVIFSIVKTKIVHYSSLCYFPLTFFAANYCYKLISSEIAWKNWNKAIFIIIGSLVSIVLLIPQFIDAYKEKIIASGIIKDNFAVQNLGANVHWSGFEFLIGVFFFLNIILFIIFQAKRPLVSVITFLVTGTLCIALSLVIIVPKVETYSQRPAIDFYKGLQEKECYVTTLGYKSYAHLFYAQTNEMQNMDVMLTDSVDKPCYFVCKADKVEEFTKNFPALKELYRKNGFVFLERESD